MKHMKQRLILFSALLIMSLSLGVASAAEENLSINITHNGTNGSLFRVGDVVNITADFNKSVGIATISITNNTDSNIVDNKTMENITADGIVGSNYSFDYTIPDDIRYGSLDLNISAFNDTFLDSNDSVSFGFDDPEIDELINVTYDKVGPFSAGDVVNITADFNESVHHANITITNNSEILLNNDSMILLDVDDNNFTYQYQIPADSTVGPLGVNISAFNNSGKQVGNYSDPDALELNSEPEPEPELDTENKLNIIVAHNGTDDFFKPGDVVNITADFNRTISAANISITDNSSLEVANGSMNLTGVNGIGGNNFSYLYTIPENISENGPFDVNISGFNASVFVDNKSVSKFLKYELNITIAHNGTGDFRPGNFVHIIANFSRPIDHANISISDGLPGVSNVNLVGASLVTDYPMDEIDDDTFAYDFQIPESTSGPLDIDISAFDDLGTLLGDESVSDGFNVGNPYIQIISPGSEFVNKSCVNFNFSAYDVSGSQITYAFLLDGVQKNNGIITSGAYKQLQFELADGYHTWEVKTNDGQPHTSGTRTLYVDTKCPSVKLISPADCYKEVISSTTFNFTCEDALTAQYGSDLDLSYTMYVDGQPEGLPGDIQLEDIASESGMDLADLLSIIYPNGKSSGNMESGNYVVKNLDLDDGVHYWYVSVEDEAGNSVTSEVRKFYVSRDGLAVTLVSPEGGKFVPSNPTFNFNVKGHIDYTNVSGPFEEGAGLPFNVKLLIDGKEVQASCLDCDCGDCNDCGGDENDDDCDDGENDNNCVGCDGGDCDESCFYVGEDNYSVTAAVPDGVNKNWTVIITDSTSGKTYSANGVFQFSVDSVAPACVANLNVEDAYGETYWQYTRDYPGLMVSWNASKDTDLAEMPYEVYISTSKPGCIEDMQKVNTTGLETHTDGSKTPNQKLENSSVTDLCIEALDGKDLVYGKDYWVAVIARDNASNYNSAFSKCGPVRTYEDMVITLEEGWNLKSVPKTLVESNDCPEDVFGNGSTVLYWDGSCWQFPDTIEPCKGYWVYTEEPRTTSAKFKGMSADGTNPDVPASLELTPGWHMIGHTTTYAVPWSTTLASLTDSTGILSSSFRYSNLITYDQDEGWGGIISDTYDGNTGNQYISGTESLPVAALQSDNYMVPGQGYWIFMKDEGTYASIENTYNPSIEQNLNSGTGNGTSNGMDYSDLIAYLNSLQNGNT